MLLIRIDILIVVFCFILVFSFLAISVPFCVQFVWSNWLKFTTIMCRPVYIVASETYLTLVLVKSECMYRLINCFYTKTAANWIVFALKRKLTKYFRKCDIAICNRQSSFKQFQSHYNFSFATTLCVRYKHERQHSKKTCFIWLVSKLNIKIQIVRIELQFTAFRVE